MTASRAGRLPGFEPRSANNADTSAYINKVSLNWRNHGYTVHHEDKR